MTTMAVAVTTMALAMTMTTLGGTATIPEAWPVVVAGLVWIRCRFMHLVMGGYCKLRHQHGELLEAQLLVLICVQILHDMVYGSVILPLLLWMGEMGCSGRAVASEHSKQPHGQGTGKPGSCASIQK